MKKKTYSVVMPDGKTAKRTTSRLFSHAIAVIEHERYQGVRRWGVTTWCGRPDLAEKELHSAQQNPLWGEARILEVIVGDAEPPPTLKEEQILKMERLIESIAHIKSQGNVEDLRWEWARASGYLDSLESCKILTHDECRKLRSQVFRAAEG